MFTVAKIEYFAVRVVARGSTQERFDDITHEIEIALLFSAAKDLNRVSFDQSANPNAEKSLAGIFDAHSRSIGIGQTQRAGANPVNVVIKQVVPLAREFVDPVYVNRIDRVLLVYRQIFWSAINLSRARENNSYIAVVQSARFQNVQLGGRVDVQIGYRIRH